MNNRVGCGNVTFRANEINYETKFSVSCYMLLCWELILVNKIRFSLWTRGSCLLCKWRPNYDWDIYVIQHQDKKFFALIGSKKLYSYLKDNLYICSVDDMKTTIQLVPHPIHLVHRFHCKSWVTKMSSLRVTKSRRNKQGTLPCLPAEYFRSSYVWLTDRLDWQGKVKLSLF